MSQQVQGFKIVIEGVETVLRSYKEINKEYEKQLAALKAIESTSGQAYKKQRKVVVALAVERARLSKENEKEGDLLKLITTNNEEYQKQITALRQIKEVSSVAYKKQKDVVIALAEEKKRLNKEAKEEAEKAKEVNASAGAYEKLAKQLKEVKKQVKDMAAAGDTATEEYHALLKKASELNKEVNKINDSVKKITIEGNDAVLKSYDYINKEHKKELEVLRAIGDTSSEAYKKQKEVVAALSAEKKRLNKEIREEEKQQKIINDNIGAYERLSLKLDLARSSLKDMAAAGNTATEEFKELEKEVKALDKQLKGIDANVGQFQRNVGNYKSHWNSVGSALGGIPVAGALATGGLMAVGTAVIEAGKYVSETTKEFISLRGAVNDVFEGSDEEIDDYTIKIKGLLDTFQDVDQESLINATAALTRQTGDYAASLELIQTGLLANKNNAGEFIEQIKEYPVFLEEAGMAGEQTIKLISEAFREGTFNDKGIDTFKAGLISLREQTPATLAALEKIGISSSDLNKIIDEKGIGGAIVEISKKAQSFGADSVEMGAVLADVFKGAGEDAGASWLPVLAELDGDISGLVDTTDKFTKNQIALLAANEELAAAQSELSKAFGATDGSLDVLKARVETFAVKALTLVISQVKAFFDAISPLYRGIYNLAVNLGFAGENTNKFTKIINRIPSPLKIVTFAFQQMNIAIEKLFNRFPQLGRLFKDNTKATKENTKAKQGNKEATKESTKARNEENKTIKGIQQELRKTQKSRGEETKSVKENKKEVALATTSLAYMRKELAELRTQLDEAPDQSMMQSTVLKITEVEAKIKDAQNKIDIFKASLMTVNTSDPIAIADVGFLDTVTDESVASIDESETVNYAKLETEAIAAEDEKRKEHAIKTKEEEEEAKRGILEKSLEAAKGFSDLITAIQLRPYELERQKIEENFAAKIKAAEGDEELQKQLAKQKEELLDKINEKELKIKRQAAIRDKGIAVSETLINTYKAATSALTAPPPFGQILAGIVTGIGLANVGKIIATPLKFARGGVLEGPSHEQGGIPFSIDNHTGFQAEGEEVLINKRSARLFAPLLSAINSFNGYGKKFAGGGAFGNINTTPTLSTNGDELMSAINKIDNWQRTFKVIAKSDEIVKEGVAQTARKRMKTIG